MNSLALDSCVEVFARGLAFTRSFVRPYIVSKIGGSWWLRDGPDIRNRRRNDEWIAPSGVDPEKLDHWARERALGRFLVSAVAVDADEQVSLRAKYRTLGYRLWRTEPLMSRSTLRISRSAAGTEVSLVDTEAMATQLAEVTREKMMPKEYLALQSSPVRCHVAMISDRIAGWARSISIGDSGWCDSMFVEPEFRRRGVGRALVEAMLRSDRTAGLTASVLVARHAGAKLYAAIGYQTMGTVLVFTPAH